MEIKNIIFDLGGVILNIDYNKTATAFQNLGISDFNELYSQFKQNSLFDDLETGSISPEIFIEQVKNVLPQFITETAIIDAWNAMLLDLPHHRIELLHGVGKKYNIYLLSNTNKIHYDSYFEYIRKEHQINFNELFKEAYYSHEIGFRKPNKNCFEFVLNKNNLNASETLFIDDSIQHIEGAKSVGIHALHLKKETDIGGLFNSSHILT